MTLKHKLQTFSKRLSVQIVFLISLILTVALTFLTLSAAHQHIAATLQTMTQQAKILAGNLASANADFLFQQDYASMENSLLRAARFPDILSISMYNAEGKPVNRVVRTAHGQIEPVFDVTKTQPLFNLHARVEQQNGRLIVWEGIHDGATLGWLKITYRLDSLTEKENAIINKGLLHGVLIILAAITLVILFLYRPFRTIGRYTHFADHMKEDFGATIPVDRYTLELERLGSALNSTSCTLKEKNTHLIKTLQEAERLAAFPKFSPIITLSLSPTGEVLYFNNAVSRLLKKLMGKGLHYYDLLPTNYIHIIRVVLAKNCEMRDIEVARSSCHLMWTFAPINNQQVHCYAVDITLLKQAQDIASIHAVEKRAAEAASEAKTTFLANMSHEIRTPLTAIIGYSESLLDHNTTMEQRVRAVNTVNKAGNHLLQIINNILDISKIEANMLEVEHIKTSLFDILEDVKTMTLFKAQEKDLSFAIDYRFPLPKAILSDPVRIKQVLINLCANAIKFTHEGGIQLQVVYVSAKKLLEISVKDTGIGMSAEQIGKLFKPFTQADVSTTRSYGGTGLGLYLSRQIAEILGGGVKVVSTVDQGSCFTFSIAIGVETPEMVVAALHTVKHPSLVGDGNRLAGSVLLAEDNENNQDLITMYLKKMGVEVDLANHGGEAVERVQQRHYDLILMDMQMPVMDGVQAMRRIREIGFQGPIVALTANSTTEAIKQCTSAGANKFLTKPIDRDQFFNTVKGYMSNLSEHDKHLQPIVSSLLNDNESPKIQIIVKKFVHSLPETIQAIRQAFEHVDWEEINAQLHQLKGVSGNFGYMDMSYLTAKMEYEASLQSEVTFAKMLEELEQMSRQVRLGIEA